MELKSLESETLYSALITACNAIVQQREQLNAINLFPVADRDTGDNMAATALAVINHSHPKDSLTETLQSMSNAAISGARGNSGMIFSQFFNGLTDYLPETNQLTTESFAQLIHNSIQGVRRAILNPVEGTIITVMDCWAASSLRLAKGQHCFKQMMRESLVELKQALDSTKTTLEVLHDAKVVDAGALGFYHFVNGFYEYLENPKALVKPDEQLIPENIEHSFSNDSQAPCNRYCTEALITADNIDKKLLAERLDPFGDCVVISGNQHLCRFHLHCNQPAEVFAAIQDLGVISQPKVDDMLRQFEVSHQKKHQIALVTDSSANIPQDILDRYQIHLIPLNLYFDEHHLLDNYCVDKERLYEKLASLKTYPTTSMPNLVKVKEKLTQLAKQYNEVLVLSLSQALSGTHAVLVKAAEETKTVHVINSRHTAGSQGLLVQYAATLIEAGLSIEQIKQELQIKIAKTHMFVLIDQFDSLIRSGRLNKATGKLAQFAHLKPIATLNAEGKVAICDKAFSQQKGFIKLMNQVKKLTKDRSILAYNIIHADASEKALEFASLTTEAFRRAPEYIDTASSVIGLHTGKGCLAISVMLD